MGQTATPTFKCVARRVMAKRVRRKRPTMLPCRSWNHGLGIGPQSLDQIRVIGPRSLDRIRVIGPQSLDQRRVGKRLRLRSSQVNKFLPLDPSDAWNGRLFRISATMKAYRAAARSQSGVYSMSGAYSQSEGKSTDKTINLHSATRALHVTTVTLPATAHSNLPELNTADCVVLRITDRDRRGSALISIRSRNAERCLKP